MAQVDLQVEGLLFPLPCLLHLYLLRLDLLIKDALDVSLSFELGIDELFLSWLRVGWITIGALKMGHIFLLIVKFGSRLGLSLDLALKAVFVGRPHLVDTVSLLGRLLIVLSIDELPFLGNPMSFKGFIF